MKLRSKNRILPILAAFLTLLITLVVAPYYTGGDQALYNEFYRLAIDASSIPELYIGYQAMLGASEPLYPLVIYLASAVVDKIFFAAIANAILSYCFINWCLSRRISIAVALAVLYTNFYVLVLFFAADRLKLACVVFMVFALLFRINSTLASVASTLAHFQYTIISVCFGASSYLVRLRYRNIVYCVAIVLFVYYVFPIQSLVEAVYSKYEFYSDNLENPFVGLLRVLPFSVVAIYLSKPAEKKAAALFQLPLVVSSLFVGADRLVLFSFFHYMAIAMQIRRGVNVYVIGPSIYFAYKAAVFVFNIFYTGDGFSSY